MSLETEVNFKPCSSHVFLQMAESDTLCSMRNLTVKVLIINNVAGKSNVLNVMDTGYERVVSLKLRFAGLWGQRK
jgi:hypothetical protein